MLDDEKPDLVNTGLAGSESTASYCHLVYHMPQGRKKELRCRPEGRHQRLQHNPYLTLCGTGMTFPLMATRKTVRRAKTILSTGTVMAAKYRARANLLTEEQRQAHRAQAMSHIHGNP